MLRSTVAALVAAVLLLATPLAAHAAECPPAAEGAPAAEARAAGDDPVSTPPTTPTCDDAGYEMEFPDVALETDEAPARIEGGGDAPTPRPTGPLPVTGTAQTMFLLALIGMLLTNVGVLTYIATQRPEGEDAR